MFYFTYSISHILFRLIFLLLLFLVMVEVSSPPPGTATSFSDVTGDHTSSNYTS